MSDVTASSLRGAQGVQNTQTVFSVDTEKGALQLLRHIHQSPLTPEDKNEIRDALFAYRISGTQADLQALIAIASEHTFLVADTPDKKTDAGAESPGPSLARRSLSEMPQSRPVPQFAVRKVQSQKEAAQELPATTPEPAPVEVKADVPKPEKSPVEVSPATVPTPSEEKQENSVPAPTVPSGQPPVPPVTKAIPETPVTPVSSVEKSNVLVRIQIIKKEINALVGNPVNLIDSHNDIGREYMNALLDAMKKNNGGTPEEVQGAMARLEKAYTAVKDVMTNVVATEAPTPAIPQAEATPNMMAEEKVIPAAPVPPVTKKEEVEILTEKPSGFVSVHDTHVAPETTIPENAVQDTPTEVSVAGKKDVPPASAPSVADSVPASAEVSAKEIQEVTTPETIMSVAKQKKIQDLMMAKKQEAATTDKQKKEAEIASMDPLMVPDVTSGLQQLLSEWSLFKSSGLFGTGPSGMDHPLYKQLSKLTMTAIVAGRFEGATPQIKRSITDYMNGWRYEEGILQEQGEMFEHYLRRVIKHILNKRK